MEILNQRNIIGRTIVREKYTIYERILYSDKTVEWNPISYDGECDEEELEKKFQDLINKPVETTNEQLTKCHCGSLLPKDGKSCGSMWCPNEH